MTLPPSAQKITISEVKLSPQNYVYATRCSNNLIFQSAVAVLSSDVIIYGKNAVFIFAKTLFHNTYIKSYILPETPF